MIHSELPSRADDRFEIVQLSGQILLAKDYILGPYNVQGDLGALEDPVIWISGGWYHLLTNNWSDQRA